MHPTTELCFDRLEHRLLHFTHFVSNWNSRHETNELQKIFFEKSENNVKLVHDAIERMRPLQGIL